MGWWVEWKWWGLSGSCHCTVVRCWGVVEWSWVEVVEIVTRKRLVFCKWLWGLGEWGFRFWVGGVGRGEIEGEWDRRGYDLGVEWVGRDGEG